MPLLPNELGVYLILYLILCHNAPCPCCRRIICSLSAAWKLPLFPPVVVICYLQGVNLLKQSNQGSRETCRQLGAVPGRCLKAPNQTSIA